MTTSAEAVLIKQEFGPYLIGRDVGKRIREQYFPGDPASWPRKLDLAGVEQITESCADELLGTLARRTGASAVRGIGIENAAPAVREAIEYILSLVDKPPPTPTRAEIERLLERRKPASKPVAR